MGFEQQKRINNGYSFTNLEQTWGSPDVLEIQKNTSIFRMDDV
jgi:hypothetical protein